MANIKDAAKKSGLNPIACKCGRKINTLAALMKFFDVIIDLCRAGEEVRVKNFGIFHSKITKGRTLISPLLKDGQIDFDDVKTLRFRQSQGGKDKLNKE